MQQKLTVAEKYQKQEIMQSKMNKLHRRMETAALPIQKELQQTFAEMEQVLLQAQQSVRQAQAMNPAQEQLQAAEQSLHYAVQQLNKLTTLAPELKKGLPKGAQQQLIQLDHEILKAGETLQLIKASAAST